MSSHLRGILNLFILTVLVCCVLYPLALWGVGRAVFREQAEGSLVTKDGKVKGSRLVGQPFSWAGYFKPRPSNAGDGYHAELSGGSNLAASNPKLRERVAADVKKLIRYRSGPKKGRRVAPDVQEWMPKDPARVAAWIKSNPLNADYALTWWRQRNPGKPDPAPEDLAGPFAASYLQENPGTWPQAADKKDAEGNPVKDKDNNTVKELQPSADATDVQLAFFDAWKANPANRDVELEPVPADAVLASASGLDPHITLRNARYQAPEVIEARSRPYPESARPEVAKRIDELIARHAFKPMWGLAGGDPLVNVLELNLDLDALDVELKKKHGVE
jgi:K+-transporting ATPase ATPase C chain